MNIARKIIESLIYSNIYLSLGAAVVAVLAAFMLGMPLNFEIIFMPFSACFLIYNMNRMTDMEEDQVNVPERVDFFKKYGLIFVFIAALLYGFGLAIAYNRNIETFAVAIAMMVAAVLYSIFRLKKYFVVKNIIVGLTWGLSSLVIIAYFSLWNSLLAWSLYAFISMEFVINTIIFDIKDVNGDKKNKIMTIPVKAGIPKTKKILLFCYGILWALFLYMLYIERIALLLVPFMLLLGAYIFYIKEDRKYPWWYFGAAVDGEFYILLATLALYMVFA